MNKMSYSNQFFTFLVVGLSMGGSIKATATASLQVSNRDMILKSQRPVLQQEPIKLAQRLMGECRAAARPTFIYQERSTANRIRSLQTNERVVLAEASGKNGWIAINSPISGFVQAKDLKPCSEPTSVSSGQNLCRQVIYQGREGVIVRERPNLDSPQVDTVFFGDQVTLSNPPEFITDNVGREWTRLGIPRGWMTNGIPARGDINLGACLY